MVAEGDISLDGDEGVSYAEYKKIFSAIRKESRIKAVVLRINSRGGSARASDLLWREVVRTAERFLLWRLWRIWRPPVVTT